MNYIGNVIREYRIMLHMSRRALASNVCSDKYLYLIEKGERTPSTEVTRLLGDKMGVDLFKYYEYLDCLEPIRVNFYIEKFNRSRRESDFSSLAVLTEEASKMPDYHNDPWKYEILLNLLAIRVLGEGDFLHSIPLIEEVIDKMENEKLDNTCYINFLVLLSTCFQMSRDLKNTYKIVIKTYESIKNKQKIFKYVQVVVAAKINKITMHYLSEEWDFVIQEALELNEYQQETCYKECLHHGFFYLAFAYYQKDIQEEGIKWFEKALSIMLFHHKPIEMFYMRSYEIFEVMIQDRRVSQDLIQRINLEYGE